MQRQAWAVTAILIAIVALVGLIVALSDLDKKGPIAEVTPLAGSPARIVGAAEVAPAPGLPFSFRRVEVDTARAVGEVCLVFSAPLDESGSTIYADYIVLEPSGDFDIRVDGSRLCLAGLAFGETYEASLRAGLPARDGTRLALGEQVPLALRDRPAFVGFGPGFVLPRASVAGLPVTTVNVAEVELSVIRVNDRLLSQLQASLVDERVIYGYDRAMFSEEQGRVVWQGTMAIEPAPNATTTTLFPLRDALAARAPGVYLVTARDAAKREAVADPYDDEYWQGRAAQWIVETDIGLSTYRGADGLTVFARSFAKAQPLDGVDLALVARDNAELGRVRTDRQGRAVFPPALLRGTGGAEPVLLMAYGKAEDFAYLDLRRPAFDLTDRGVGGRATPGPVDAYLFTERGVYRPGETVSLTALVRDREATALNDLPITLVMRRPDGLEYRKLPLGSLSAGAAQLPLTLTDTAPRGRWSVAAYLDLDQRPVGRVEFDVQDFVPERLKLAVSPILAPLAPGAAIEIPFIARFLYGAPAGGLDGEAEYRLVRAEDPFPDFPGYRFGLAEEPLPQESVRLSVSTTDETGAAAVSGVVPADLEVSTPLEAVTRLSVFEPGGRTTDEQLRLAVRAKPLFLGLRTGFADDTVPENSEARFDLIALDADGAPVARTDLDYSFVQEDVDYQWYELDGEWRYEVVVRDRLLKAGRVSVAPDAPTALAHVIGWGRYRLTVRDPATQAETSVRFYGGWGATGSDDRPDRIVVTADKPRYAVGDDAMITLRPPVAGKALVVIASDRIHAVETIDVPAGGASLTLPVQEAWGAGAYALVTLYRPLAADSAEGAPARAIGLAFLDVDMADRMLDVAIETPEIVQPRTTVDVPVVIANARPGEALKVVLAAVDEGILQLTDYESPSPTDYYFGKRRLGLDIRDDYGRLIVADDAAVGPIREGGDSLGGRSLAAVPTRTVALFSGLVDIDDDGRAVIALAIPDFVGELRLMAVAVGSLRLGQAARPLTVRDPVVAEVTLPRFLAPGDVADATLLIDNVDGPTGPYRASLGASGAVATAAEPVEVSLASGERRTFALSLEAGAVGIGTVSLTLEGPDGLRIQRAWPIAVRAPALDTYRQVAGVVLPGGETQLDAAILQGLRPETTAVSLAIAGTKGFDIPGLLAWLDRYPYGCLEQTTSRAMPLLYVKDLARAAGLVEDRALEDRVQRAVERIVDMQRFDGRFGMWGARSDAADPWLSVFAVDLLAEARTQGFVVPEAALTRAFDGLRKLAGEDWHPPAARAYALYVLARAGAVPPGDVRYFYDTQAKGFVDAATPALAAAALAALGDQARATEGFDRARQIARDADPGAYQALAYGSLLRDVAAVTALAAGAGATEILPDVIARTAALEPPVALTTTQEKAWLLRAAKALETLKADIAVEVRGAMTPTLIAARYTLAPSTEELSSGVTLVNTGAADAWWTLTATGIPIEPPPAFANGLTIEKRVYTLDGAPAALGNVRQSARLIVSVRGTMPETRKRDIAVLDLLPAGFEIEAVVEPRAGGIAPYGFLDDLTAVSIAEARDDRFVAAFALGSTRHREEGDTEIRTLPFHVAYIVRAVTPGRYILPGAHVEDMYSPEIRALGAASSLVIRAD